MVKKVGPHKFAVVHGHPQKAGSKTDRPKGSVIKTFPTKKQAQAMHTAIILSQKRRSHGNQSHRRMK